MKNTKPATEAAAKKKRTQVLCKRGHPLSGNNLYVSKDGRRMCKKCRYDSTSRFLAIASTQMAVDPNDKRHGTINGYRYGCRCRRCCFVYSEHQISTRNPKIEESVT